MIETAALVLVGIALISDILLVLLWLVNFKSDMSDPEYFPEVDILVAARNEEENIGRCLNSLISLDYPVEKVNIWVGDDGSSDKTWKLIRQFQEKYPNVHGYKINEHIVKGNGKANVLAQLAHYGKAEWMFMTDADIAVPKQWVKAMLGAAQAHDLALVTGTSLVEGVSFLARFQLVEWLYATSMLKVVSDLGVQATTMGNNMAIKREAYEEVGGYENIPFSVTEDLELFKQVKKRYATRNLFASEVLNKSVPQTSVKSLYVQRKRWMKGAFQLPFSMLVILVVQAMYFPAVITLFFLSPVLGIVFWFLKWFTKYSFLTLAARKLTEKLSIFDSFVMDLASVIFSITSLVYYFWPGKISWKGRKY